MLDDSTRLVFPASGMVELPLIFEPQLLRCRAVGPGGHTLTVLLDTGTDPSAIDLRLARRLGLRLGDFALGQDAISDTVPFTETVVPWLRLGGLQVRNLFALALDLRATPFAVDIVLGYNVLRQVIFHVDYQRRLVGLSHLDLGEPTATGAETLLPLTFFEHFPALANGTLCETIPLPLLTIDTGSNSSLTLAPDLARQVGLQYSTRGAAPGQGRGFASQGQELVFGRARSLRLGPLALPNVELDTPIGGGGDLGRAGRANIGNRLLARFASITLDYQRGLCRVGLPVPGRRSLAHHR